MLRCRAAGCGPGLVRRGGGRPSFAAAHLGALGSCVLGPGTSLPTGFYWAQPLAAFALKGRFAFQSAGTPARGGRIQNSHPSCRGAEVAGDPEEHQGPRVSSAVTIPQLSPSRQLWSLCSRQLWALTVTHEDAPGEPTQSLQPFVPQEQGALGSALILKSSRGQGTTWAVPAIPTLGDTKPLLWGDAFLCPSPAFD